jgi:acetyl-CoA acetyltransferase
MADIYIVGAGMAKFGKRSESLVDIMCEAANAAIVDSGCNEFDAIYIGSMNPEEFVGEYNLSPKINERLGLIPVRSSRVESASSTGAATFEQAFLAAASGFFNCVLVIAGEKMSAVSTERASKILAEVLSSSERACGATMPGLAAMVTRRYMHEFGMTREATAAVALKSHKNGSRNKYAQFQKEIKEEDYYKSKIVADPLCLYDCAPISDGAAAVVISSNKGRVRICGIGQGTDFVSVQDRESLTSFNATIVAAQKAYKMANMSPRDIDVAEIHDAFTSFEILGAEDTGLFEKGTGWKRVLEGETKIGGRLPVNPSGGLKSRGHPVGASGLAQIVEMTWQLRGEAGMNQVSAGVGLTLSIGGFGDNNLVTILEKA